jgi:hypothetical protein
MPHHTRRRILPIIDRSAVTARDLGLGFGGSRAYG